MRRLSLDVIVATRGRQAEAAGLAANLAAQSRPPDRLIFAVADRADAPAGAGDIVTGPPGLTKQRNRGMAASDAEILVFYDDDFTPAPGALAAIERFFAQHTDIAGATGRVIADGIGGASISAADAARYVAGWRPPPTPDMRRVIGLYGCNMAVRAAAARDLWFDERLPLYGWQEDLDFGARLSLRGRVVRTNAFAGVHRGVRAARPREVGLGYAQVANPVYLMLRPGAPRRYLAKLMARNLAANHFGSLLREDHVDRRGRLRGNWRALADLARGRLRPEGAVGL